MTVKVIAGFIFVFIGALAKEYSYSLLATAAFLIALILLLKELKNEDQNKCATSHIL